MEPAQSKKDTGSGKTKPSSASKKTPPKSPSTKSVKSSSSKDSDHGKTEVKKQPEKGQSGEAAEPSQTTASSTLGPEEKLDDDFTQPLWWEEMFQLMKDQRPTIENLLHKKLEDVGIKPVS